MTCWRTMSWWAGFSHRWSRRKMRPGSLAHAHVSNRTPTSGNAATQRWPRSPRAGDAIDAEARAHSFVEGGRLSYAAAHFLQTEALFLFAAPISEHTPGRP